MNVAAPLKPPPLSIPQCAEALGIRPTTVRKMIRERRITHFRIGARVLIPADEVDRLIAKNTVFVIDEAHEVVNK